MQTISDIHRKRIARLIGDPRYWNKSHPEHAKVFADVQRTFNDAYPEPSDRGTTVGSVHVRAYKRTQDGKEIDVSAYDRRQEVAMAGPPALKKLVPRSGIEDVSNNKEHDRIQFLAMAGLMKTGARVAADVRVRKVSNGLAGIPDLVAIYPDGRHVVIEVKTGFEPKWTQNQPEIYPLMQKGYEVFADDNKLESLGFHRGERLPPFDVYVAYSPPPYDTVYVSPLDEAPIAPGKRLDDGHKGLK